MAAIFMFKIIQQCTIMTQFFFLLHSRAQNRSCRTNARKLPRDHHHSLLGPPPRTGIPGRNKEVHQQIVWQIAYSASGTLLHLPQGTKTEEAAGRYIHCLAHRLELAFRDVIKKSTSKLYDKLLTLLLGLYYTYHKAPKQKKQLGDTFQLLGVGSVTPTRVGGTRWLPHMNRALKALIKGYRAFRMQLEESSNHNNPKAEGMAKIIADKNVIVYMLTLQEVISPLVRLSQYLQKRETTLAAGMERVLATQDMLRNLKLKWVFYVVVVTHAI